MTLFCLMLGESGSSEKGVAAAIIAGTFAIIVAVLGLWLDKVRMKEQDAINGAHERQLQEIKNNHANGLEKLKEEVETRLAGYKNYLEMEKDAFKVKLKRMEEDFTKLRQELRAIKNEAVEVKHAATGLKDTTGLSADAEPTWMGITLDAFRNMTKYFVLTKHSTVPEFQRLQRAAVALFVAIDPKKSGRPDKEGQDYKQEIAVCYDDVLHAVNAVERYCAEQESVREKEIEELHRNFPSGSAGAANA